MYKVMIVDDEDIIVAGLKSMLPWERFGCQVVATAGDGKEALALVSRHKPDILFTDIRMPGMDGLSLIAALRSEYPHMQITILSGYPEFDYAQKAIRLGVRHYILKPSKMAELEDALRLMTETLAAQGLPGQGVAVEPAGGEPGKAPGVEPGTGEGAESGDNAGNFIIHNAVKYMEGHYAEKLTLPDVAQQVYVSQWHLSKLIAKNTGQSFSDLLNGVRIREAKRLLADPSLKIWEISERVGFSDVTHFSRIFKKIENRSANEYRNSLGAQ